MSNIRDTLAKLEFAQIGWVVPDINATVKFLEKSLGVDFPKPERYSAEDLNIKYYGKVVPSDGLTTQTFNGGAFIDSFSLFQGKVYSMITWQNILLAEYSIWLSDCRLMVSTKLLTT
jgi:hypothetical protein